MKKIEFSAQAEAVLEGKSKAVVYSGGTGEFTRADWLALAFSALDQAGGRGREVEKAFDAVKELLEDEVLPEEG